MDPACHLDSSVSAHVVEFTLAGPEPDHTQRMQGEAREPVRPRGRLRRPERAFALAAALAIVLVGFQVLYFPARAAPAPVLFPMPAGPVYANGMMASYAPDGTVRVANLATFQRWDGAYLSISSLNLTNGNWPYLLRQNASSFTVTRLGDNFTQAKVPGAIYTFQPNAIKETIVITSPSSAPFDAIGIGFRGSYLPYANRNVVDLIDHQGNIVWQTEPFVAQDSAPTPRLFSNPVPSVGSSPGALIVHLDPDMVTWAQYPLYIDPTWVLKASPSNVWSGALNRMTSDWGDANLRLGLVADNFDDGTNEIWTVSSGTSFVLTGGAAQLTATHIRATGAWYNVSLEATLNFAKCGDSDLAFRYASSSNYYYLYVNFGGQKITLYKVISGTKTAIAPTISMAMSAKTTYDAKVVARGNYFEIWWQGSRLWSGTDGSPPASPVTGSIELSEVSSGCTLTVDNARLRDPNVSQGNYTSPVRGAQSGYNVSQVRFVGTTDAFYQGLAGPYSAVDLWIRSSSDNQTWGSWHVVKTMAAPGVYYQVPDADQKQYYQLRLVERTGVDGTPSAAEVDSIEATPTSVSPGANTGKLPWYPYAGGLVNLVNGNLYYTASDIAFQGKAFTISVTRSYNSLLAGVAGPFGQGWTFNLGQSLTVGAGGNVTWNGPDGSSLGFVAIGTAGGFSPPRGDSDRLVKNADGTFTLWMIDGTSEHFSSVGLLLSSSDRNGNQITMSYSGSPSHLVKVADATGKAMAFSYDGSNRITTITDPAGRKVTYTYSSTNGLTSYTDPLGNSTQYTYYPGTPIYLKQIVDPLGKSTLVNYISGGKVASLWVQYVNTGTLAVNWQFQDYALSYNSSVIRAVESARNYWTTVILNSLGNLISIAGPHLGCSCDAIGNSSTYVWDGEMNRLSVADGRRNTRFMTYGDAGNLLTTTDAGSNVSSQAWLEVNNVTSYYVVPYSSTTSRHFTTTMSYDWRGNLLSVTDPGGNTTRHAYDSSGFLNKTVTRRGFTTWYVYNGSGDLVKQEDNLSESTTYTYDILGRQTAVTDAMGFVRRTAYDADSRVTKATDPKGNFTTYRYDKRGDLVQQTDPDGATTTYAYNVTSVRIQGTTDSGGNITNSSYDLRGNLNSTVDANSHRTYYRYDAFDRLTRVTTPLGYVTKYVYDAAGNRIARTDGNGALTKYAYDKLNRLSATMYPGPPVYQSPQTLTYKYDQDGNMIQAVGFGYTETKGYDRSDRLAWSLFNYGTFSANSSYTYNADGERATMKDGAGNITRFYYDAADRLTAIVDPAGHNTSFSYDHDSRQIGEHQFNGITQTWVYDAASRLLTLYTNNSAGNVEGVAYTVDKLGLRTGVNDTLTLSASMAPIASCPRGTPTGGTIDACTGNDGPSGVQSPQAVKITLASAGTLTGGPGATVTVYFSYFQNGNMVTIGQQTVTLSGQGTGTYGGTFTASVTVRNGDTLQGVISDSCSPVATPCAQATSITISYVAIRSLVTYEFDKIHRTYKIFQSSGTTTDTYDAVGNPATESAPSSSTSYTYDADNELVATTIKLGTIGYTYDKDGNRLTSCFPGLLCPTTSSTYDYENRMVSSGGCTYTYAPTGERASSNCGSTTDYAYDYATRGGSPNLAAQYSASGSMQNRYIQGNAVNSPVELVQGSSTYAYEVDGLGSVSRLTGTTGGTSETYTYDTWGNPSASGSVSNPLQFTGQVYDSTGLYYDRARFYDPSTNGGHQFLSGDPAGSGYSYAADNPANFMDPTGMKIAGCGDGWCGAPPPTPPPPPPGGYPPAPAGTPAPPAPPAPPAVGSSDWMGKCGMTVLFFALDILFTWFGLGLDEGLAGAIYDAHTSWAVDGAQALATGSVWDFIGFLLDIAGTVILNYIIPAFDWWAAMTFSFEVASDLSGIGIALEFAFIAAMVVQGLYGVLTDCVIPAMS